jgi:hypothetical protein
MAKAFMTVANIPILSALARSIPLAADYKTKLYAKTRDDGHIASNRRNCINVDPKSGVAHQHLARHL